MPQARLRSLLAPLALLALTTPIAAQGTTACLQGRVFGGPGVPLAGARVTVTFTAFTTTTDDSGRYVFLSIPADTVDVRVTYVGHTALRVDGLQLPAGGSIRQDFVLEPSEPRPPQPRDAGTSAAASGDRTPPAPPRAPAERCPPSASGVGNSVSLNYGVRTASMEKGKTIGDPTGDRNTYVDGVPVQQRTSVVDSTTGRVEGVIRREDGAPLAAARVTIVGTPLRTVTDSLGRFRLQSIPPGLVTIRVTRPEFRDALIEGLRLRGGQLIVQDVVLARAP
jgi:hypothetical protein